MPIYEYLCQGCGTKSEVKQKMSDAPLTTCERCGGALTKLISASGIMFKGSGWYVTDYSDKMKPPTEGKSEKAEKSDKAEKPAAADSSASSGGSDSKPAEKPAAASAPAASTSSPAASGASSGSGSGSATFT